MTGVVLASAFAAGQVVGVLVLVVIAGFAIRDQLRKRKD
jgi:hypothetical protein